MKSNVSTKELTLTDSPGCFWIFGAFFCIIGILSILTALVNMNKEFPAWQILIVIILGLASNFAGVYIIFNSPISRIVINKANNDVRISHRGLLRNENQIIGIADIQNAYMLKGKDIDGGPVYTLRFQMRDGRELPVTHLWLHNKKDLEQILSLLGDYLSIGNMREKGKQ